MNFLTFWTIPFYEYWMSAYKDSRRIWIVFKIRLFTIPVNPVRRMNTDVPERINDRIKEQIEILFRYLSRSQAFFSRDHWILGNDIDLNSIYCQPNFSNPRRIIDDIQVLSFIKFQAIDNSSIHPVDIRFSISWAVKHLNNFIISEW